jgi:hypothetical protein
MLPHLTVPRRSRWRAPSLLALTVLTGSTLIAATSAGASAHGPGGAIFQPGDLLVSGSVYDNNPSILTPGVTVLPPGCTTGCVVATNDGSYPGVWDNALADASFGLTSPIFLDQLTPSGRLLSTLRLPDGSRSGSGLDGDHMVTSFSSKSELALNLSTGGRYVTFMGYVAKPDAIDVSNSNTPGVVDPTNPVAGTYYRVLAQLDSHGRLRFTETNAYSGNNGRSAILNDSHGASVVYTAGNAGNGANPQPDGVILGAGASTIIHRRSPASPHGSTRPAVSRSPRQDFTG